MKFAACTLLLLFGAAEAAAQNVPSTPARPSPPASSRPQASWQPDAVLAVVNAARAARGLRPLAYDADLAAWAQRNNAAQSRGGLGHHVNPNAWQVAASSGSPHNALVLWINSRAHNVIIFNPSLTRAGGAIGWGYATLNLR